MAMSFRKSLYSLLVTVVVVVTAVQVPLNSGFEDGLIQAASAFDPFDAALFTPIEDLSLLTTDTFTTLTHPAFPRYNVRIKRSDWCDGTVRYAPFIT